MWAILKFENKKINLLKNQISKSLGKDTIFYQPKILIKRYIKNRLRNKEFNILGDYLFCFHKKFKDEKNVQNIKNVVGLKSIINGFYSSQDDIQNFINHCKQFEDNKGFLTSSYFSLIKEKNYVLNSGPFVKKIFSVIDFQKNKINLLLGNLKTTINKKNLSFSSL